MFPDFAHTDFNLSTLDLKDLAADPRDQFSQWYNAVIDAGVADYPAMTLATCGTDGRPSARIVYLRGFDQRGFVFYTNYLSRKGKELAETPFAALCFFWKEFERQVRLEGRVEQISAEESDAYFAERPLDTRLGAWASAQSDPLESVEELAARVDDFRQRFADRVVLRPPHWGGYRLVPDRIEFWQGRPSRLHDRFVYQLDSNGAWSVQRLNP